MGIKFLLLIIVSFISQFFIVVYLTIINKQ